MKVHMKKLLVSLVLTVCIQSQMVNASGYIQYNARTGDTSLDLQLSDMNIKAKANLNDFVSTLGIQYQTSTSKINHLIVDYNFTPADAYMTLSISKETNRSIHDVAHSYKDNKSKGWGFVAKQMGIKPGSKAFHQLKKGMKASNKKNKNKSEHSKSKNKHKDKGNKGNKGNNKNNSD